MQRGSGLLRACLPKLWWRECCWSCTPSHVFILPLTLHRPLCSLCGRQLGERAQPVHPAHPPRRHHRQRQQRRAVDGGRQAAAATQGKGEQAGRWCWLPRPLFGGLRGSCLQTCLGSLGVLRQAGAPAARPDRVPTLACHTASHHPSPFLPLPRARATAAGSGRGPPRRRSSLLSTWCRCRPRPPPVQRCAPLLLPSIAASRGGVGWGLCCVVALLCG